MRTFVIGDIHGCNEALQTLLEKIKPDPDQDRLVFLGDYIDRGPSSKEVVETLLSLRRKLPGTIFLKGNHEDAFVQCLGNPQSLKFYLQIGGAQTVESYGLEAREDLDLQVSLPAEHISFLTDLLPYWENDDFIFVHAGLKPGVHLTQQAGDWLYWGSSGRFIDVSHDFGKRVVFGHNASEVPIVEPNKIGIDTGAVYGGSLTCLILPEMTFVSAKCQKFWPIDGE